jgi:DNA repair protein RadC
MPTKLKLYELKKLQSDFPAVTIGSSKDAADFIRQFYTDDIEIFESSFLLLMNRARKTIGYAKISQGGITGTVVDLRLVAKYAVESLATQVIMAHNHPSGNLKASPQDIDITKKAKLGLGLLDIIVDDHIILTKDGYTSLADEGLM